VFGYAGPVLSTEVTGYPSFNPPAPTGTRTFGNYADGFTGGVALELTFHTQVSNVSLLANNFYPPGVATYWAAFDGSGNWLAEGYGGIGVPAGETYALDIDVDNLAKVLVGASDGSRTSRLDRLTFEVGERYAEVPEPQGTALLGLGLVGVVVYRCQRKRIDAFRR
jgi:hypothetical protein